jgi:hypothetical protein
MTNIVFSNNVLTGMGDVSNGFQASGSTASGSTYSNNVWIDVDKFSAGTAWNTVSGNEYYDSLKPAWDTAPAVNVASATDTVWDNQFCTTIKRITNPTTQCFDMALHDDNVPAAGITKPSGFYIAD